MDSVWNKLITIRDRAKTMSDKYPDDENPKNIFNTANMYLHQLNARSSIRLEKEARNWLTSIYHFTKF